MCSFLYWIFADSTNWESNGICVLDGVLFADLPGIHCDFRFRGGEAVLTDHMQIHLLELPKYDPPGNDRKITDPIEEWAFFFRQVQNLTAEEVADRLGDPLFAEAAGVLEMIARSPKERDLYEARLKLQRDEEARLRYAREQGNLAGRVQLLQELLGEEVSAMDDLRSRTLVQLTTAEADLKRRLKDRQS